MNKIKDRVLTIFNGFGIKNPKIKFTKNYTNIGGCDKNGVIYLSLPFILNNSDKAIKGLIAHEIAHLKHFNHGKKFKELSKKMGFDEKEFVLISKYVVMCPRCVEFVRINKLPKNKEIICKICYKKGITQKIMKYKHDLTI